MVSMGLAELSLALDRRLDELISPERAAHSRRVAVMAQDLCSREGLDPERGRVAGLAHDMCKEMPKRLQRELAASYSRANRGFGLTDSMMADKIVHGPAASALLARDYGLTDEEILEAVAVHTVGRPGMEGLATIVYCADKLEPGRERLEGGDRESCLALPLPAMLLSVVEGVVAWMRSQGHTVAPETLILYSSLVGEAEAR
jgi:predicted HD superfamily hydrolase involved in NAD metabolism